MSRMLEILSSRTDVGILLESDNFSPELRRRLSEELDRLHEETDKLVDQSFEC